MKPDKEGMWEWFSESGEKQVVPVLNVSKELGEVYLRVYFRGGYYNVHDEGIGEPDESFCKAEWPDRWGKRVGDLSFGGNGSLGYIPATTGLKALWRWLFGIPIYTEDHNGEIRKSRLHITKSGVYLVNKLYGKVRANPDGTVKNSYVKYWWLR